MNPAHARFIRVGGISGFAVLVVAATAMALNWTFWDRYLHAYTFQSFIDNPFPTLDRLYPQERVKGVGRPSDSPVGEEPERTIGDTALAQAVAFAEQSASTSLLVSHNGRLQLERYWRGAGPEVPVYSFSMHKSVVALLVGIAIAEGPISGVDDPVALYLPQWSDDERGRISIRNLLQMNSGLEPMEFPRNPFSRHVRRQIGTDIAAAALSYRLQDEPGTTFRYNGVNPTLLVIVLERATGKRYADLLSEKLWRPLGNRDAAVWLDRDGGLARGATSLYAVPRDWLRMGEMLLNGGRVDDRQIVPAGWIEQMTTPSKTNPLYGSLIWIGSEYSKERTLEPFKGFAAVAQEPFAAPDIIYFDGLGGQRVYIIPSREMVIVRTGVLAREWDDARLPNILISGIEEPNP